MTVYSDNTAVLSLAEVEVYGKFNVMRHVYLFTLLLCLFLFYKNKLTAITKILVILLKVLMSKYEAI